MTDRSPGEGRYAHVEREQRWSVGAVPAGATRLASILDRYITGTRLRVRRAESPDGSVVCKLGQKVRADVASPEVVKLTNMYLSPEEYAVVAALPAAELRKTRWRTAWEGKALAVDELHDRLDGILVAEVELADGDAFMATPPFAVADVTYDNRFSGGALAFATDDEIDQLRAELRAR